ncbi:hypothetical protein NQ318_000484 [Aromia moschata]|uniref:Integrase p58-like C-terminal domain-containing protein n=1 Tax=Aromia moschata TaxID=1265417 RepID=A0AAV8X7P7_9CUCU|nr:hypothetical protein NQ318_000484 [Aromia moschata]
MDEYVDGKFEEMESKLVTVEEFQNKFFEIERKIATLSLETGGDIDRSSKPELSSHMEISKIRMKPPQFDGKSSWVNYLRQFEAAAKANGWSLAEKATALTLALRGDATDILQSLSVEVRHLEMLYGQSHLEHVYHSQLKNRYQRSNEPLQESEANIARFVRLAYSSTPENVMERLAVQAFLDGLRDTETRQALTLARPSKLVEALAQALEFEGANQSCRGQAKVRKMEEDVEEGTCNEAEIRRAIEDKRRFLDKRSIHYWNCAEIEGELILGMHVMNTKGFELDFKNSVLKINGEEIVLHRKTEETIRVVLAEDTAVPERSEMILDARLVPRVMEISWCLSHDDEVARGTDVGKVLLLTEKNSTGYCSSVSSVIRKLDTQGNSVRKITGALANLLSYSSRSLRSDQTTKLGVLLLIVSDHQKDWDQFLHLFLLAYRSSVHETTGQTPAIIVMGRELRLLYDLKFGCTPGDDVAEKDYVSTLRQRMDDIHERVHSSIQGASDRMKETYDINANDGRYQPGNQVSSWEGPYEVVTRINDVVYPIQKLPRGKPRVVHFL